MWPSSNQEYWVPKITRNVERDQINYAELKKLGWKVLVVWECSLKKKDFDETMKQLAADIEADEISEVRA